jgi:ABC-type uncharacterized transport system substrate-binding protein
MLDRFLSAFRPRAGLGFVALAGLCVLAMTARASAHPHVFVEMDTTVVYDGDMIVALTHRWTFDDVYTSDVVQNLDENGDGIYTREELAGLAKINMEGLKEVRYFTDMRLGETPIEAGVPSDAYAEYDAGKVTLNFTLPLAKPVPASSPDFNFAVYDETYYVALDYADATRVHLTGAPAGCAATLDTPPTDEPTQRLSDAFAQELGTGSFGLSMARTVRITCAPS